MTEPAKTWPTLDETVLNNLATTHPLAANVLKEERRRLLILKADLALILRDKEIIELLKKRLDPNGDGIID